MLTCVALHPESERVASGDSNGVVRLWDTARTECIAAMQAHDGGVTSLVFHENGQEVVSAGRDRRVLRLDVAASTSTLVLALPHRVFEIAQIKRAHGRHCAVGRSYDGHAVRLWELEGHGHTHTLSTDAGTRFALVSLFDDGKRIALVAWPDKLVVWSLERRTVRALTVEGAQLTAIAVAPSGELAFSGDVRGMVRGWDLASGRLLFETLGAQSATTCAAVDERGEVLLTGHTGGEACVYDIASGERLGCWRGPRPVTCSGISSLQRDPRGAYRGTSGRRRCAVLVTGDDKGDLWFLDAEETPAGASWAERAIHGRENSEPDPRSAV